MNKIEKPNNLCNIKKTGNMNKFIYGTGKGSRRIGSNKIRRVIGKKK